ncbi:hypothetical protein [Acinetobacter bereziniae]|uniref:hypothetical protein n=1 Tax=Acinetobacter bereziniae TaxID=106648 RepID=UPI001905E683|nr:hypothetical protein [Acinetobacter bereziniae]QQC82506.1 hypothetical protein I9192_10800 [Acinetobacter bereziniae]
MIHRINVFLLSLIVALAPAYLYASGNQIDQAIKRIDDLRNKINNMGIEINKTRKSATGTVRTIADIVNEAGQKQTVARTAVVEQKLNPIKLGQSMMKRIKAVGKGSVPSILGTVAITGLLEGIGWVMEDGTLVKKKEKESSKDDTSPVLYCGTSNTVNVHHLHKLHVIQIELLVVIQVVFILKILLLLILKNPFLPLAQQHFLIMFVL